MAEIRVGETWVDELVSQGKWQLTIVVELLKRVITWRRELTETEEQTWVAMDL